ncbi:unnamed protein product [Effrenium voratum]|nr:unnamed protein product [Effrenium voratum]
MATQKKRRRVTPTPVVAEPAPTPEAAAPEGVPPEAAPQAALPSQEALRGPLAEAKLAVEGLQPLKVVAASGYLAALLRDARILVFDHAELLYETSIAHFCEPADLLSVHLRDTGEPVVAAAGQVFFYQRKVGEWLTYEGAKTPISREGDLLLASLPGMEEFRHVFEDFASSADADPQQFRGWCARKTDLKSLVELPSLSPSLADVRDELAGDYAYLQQL